MHMICKFLANNILKPARAHFSSQLGLVWFGFMAYQTLLVIQCQILFLQIY